jgi:hypothetical protein|tara:strand:- start:309 stop:944 length:636 start_codon:yes stop_codon:yes gene_type:complete
MNYTQLVTEIQSYTENEFVTVDINTFITQAEQRIYNGVQLAYLRKNTTGTLTSSNKYLSLPTDWLDVFSLAVVDGDGLYSYLLNKDVNFIRESFPDPTVTGQPGYYALFDSDTLILGPTPNSNYTVELHYYYYPESITTTASGTTWVGDNFSSVLLYGSILEAYTFMKGEPDMLGLYQKRYDEAFAMLKELAEYKNRNDTYRAGQKRVANV